MKTGLVQGGIDSIWVVVHDSGELTAPLSRYDIGGLNGDVDEEYRIIARIINGYAGGVNYLVRFNNDSGSNYSFQEVDGGNITAGASRSLSINGIYRLGTTSALGDVNFADCLIYAKSGKVRIGMTFLSELIVGTTINDVGLWGFAWNNTTDNLTNLTINSGQVNGIGVGSRIILLKKVTISKMKTGLLNVKGKVMGAWQKIAETTLSSPASSVDFSSLDGNADVLYKLIVRRISNGQSYPSLRFNGDVGSNYGLQRLSCSDTIASAVRNTAYTATQVMAGLNPAANGDICFWEHIIYARSGFLRTALGTGFENCVGTAIATVTMCGGVWNNTPDKLTSINIVDDLGGANKFGIGTHIELWRLNL